MGVSKKIRELNRYREIVNTLVRSGFGYMVKELGLASAIRLIRRDDEPDPAGMSIAARLRVLLEDLGPTFVKLGQIASTRPDLLPPDIISELEKLQDRAHPFSFEEAAQIIEEDLGAPPAQLFSRFDKTPIAAASIGQVYRAVLPDGTGVAVKVQRPNIRKVIETDLDILAELARLAENRLSWAQTYRVGDMVKEIAKALRQELDYEKEARNTAKSAAACAALPYVKIPRVYPSYSSKRVMTMEFIEGIKLAERNKLIGAGYDLKQIAERFATALLHMILIEGHFHGDPHPGNVLVLPGERISFIDFGMVGKLSPEMKRHFAAFVIALRNQSTDGIIRAIRKMGLVPEDADLEELRSDVDELRDQYYKMPLHQVRVAEAVNDLFSVAFRHNIRIPAELTLLGKTLLTMEGVVTALDPEFSVFAIAEPFGKRLFLERLDPRNAIRSWLEDASGYADWLHELPSRLMPLSDIARKGKIGLEITAPELESALNKLEKLGNRFSFSIILLSFSIIMLGLIVGSSLGNQSAILRNIPAVEIGFVIATLMFVWLLAAIFRSGKF